MRDPEFEIANETHAVSEIKFLDPATAAAMDFHSFYIFQAAFVREKNLSVLPPIFNLRL